MFEMAPHFRIILVIMFAAIPPQASSYCPETEQCAIEFPLTGGHCTSNPFDHCSKEELCKDKKCHCCPNCINDDCFEPGYACFDYRIAMENPNINFDECKRNLCRLVLGIEYQRCLCCPVPEIILSPTPPPPTPTPPTPTPPPPTCPETKQCAKEFPFTGGHCTSNPFDPWCKKKLCKYDNCFCCPSCINVECHEPGYACFEYEIAKEMPNINIDECIRNVCEWNRELEPRRECLCCPVPDIILPPTPPPPTPSPPTPTPPPPSSCDLQCVCEKVYPQGGICKAKTTITPNEKKFCKETKLCPNESGYPDPDCVCCENCLQSEKCKGTNGVCVDLATADWSFFNFDVCYESSEVRCEGRMDSQCVCCGWNNPKENGNDDMEPTYRR